MFLKKFEHTIFDNMIQKFLFLDIDGVLTPNAKYTPGVPPKITLNSKKVLKKAYDKDFKLVFWT